VRWALLLPLLLADCGGSAPDTGAPATDEMLQRQTHAGKLAFELERNEEAAAQYRTALSRAQARDDPDAIGDTGYNLAVAELRANTPDKALADARATRIELERRGSKPFPALLLAEATALYRTGAATEADRAARRIQQSEDADAVARATFLRGLIADDRGDEAGLATTADALTTAKTPPFEADSAELSARLPWPSKEERLSALATKSLPPISFFALGAAPPPKATRPAPVIGSAARCRSGLAASSVVMPPTYCVTSIKATTDRFAGRMSSPDVS
jgi:hypothetical protein